MRSPGAFLFRFATRAFAGVLFQLPPRLTRFEPPALLAERPLARGVVRVEAVGGEAGEERAAQGARVRQLRPGEHAPEAARGVRHAHPTAVEGPHQRPDPGAPARADP